MAGNEFEIRLTVRDLTEDDVPGLRWSGGPSHLSAVRQAILRVNVDYLGAFLPSGKCVGKAAVDYQADPGAGVIWQVAVHDVMQSCGIGSRLLVACEQRIKQRGLMRAELGVELNNPRAQRLYESLGYVRYGQRNDGWEHDGPNGTVERYETVIALMRKML
jgi:ribosomal protein S18 acetylase RimI-like enzyme